MPVVSVSLPQQLVDELDRLREYGGFSGRSDVVRTGLRSLVAEKHLQDALSGRLHCVLLAVHSERDEDDVTEVKHRYNDVITTQVHSHLGSEKCLEVFILEGPAERIRGLLAELQSSRRVDYARLVAA